MSNDFEKLEAEADKELAEAYGAEQEPVAKPTDSGDEPAQESHDTTGTPVETEVVSEVVEEQQPASVPESQYKDAIRGMNKAQQEAAALRKEVAAMQAQIQQLMERKPEEPELKDESLDGFREEYPELYEMAVNPLLKQIEALKQHVAKFDSVASRYEQDRATIEQQSHNQAILQAHPDAFELVETPDFQAWASKQGPFVQYALTQGSADEVVDALNLYRMAKPVEQRQAQRTDKLAEARAAATPSVRSSQSEPKKTKFTLAEIEKMSRDEFVKHEAAIDEAIARGELVY